MIAMSIAQKWLSQWKWPLQLWDSVHFSLCHRSISVFRFGFFHGSRVKFVIWFTMNWNDEGCFCYSDINTINKINSIFCPANSPNPSRHLVHSIKTQFHFVDHFRRSKFFPFKFIRKIKANLFYRVQIVALSICFCPHFS